MRLGNLDKLTFLDKLYSMRNSVVLLFGLFVLAFVLIFFAVGVNDATSLDLRDKIIKIDAYLSVFESNTDKNIRQREMEKVDSLLAILEKDYMGSVPYYRALGKTMILKGRILEAYNALLTARDKDRGKNTYQDLDRLAFLASLYFSNSLLNQKATMEAGQVIDYGLSIIPNNDQLINNKALYFKQLNIMDSALVYFNQAYNINPKNQQTKKNFFLHLIQLGDQATVEKNYNVALSMYTTAEKLDSKNPSLLLQIGKIFQLAGNSDKANEYYNKVLAIDPNNEIAKSSIR